MSDEPALLASCYRASLTLARENGLASWRCAKVSASFCLVQFLGNGYDESASP